MLKLIAEVFFVALIWAILLALSYAGLEMSSKVLQALIIWVWLKSFQNYTSEWRTIEDWICGLTARVEEIESKRRY